MGIRQIAATVVIIGMAGLFCLLSPPATIYGAAPPGVAADSAKEVERASAETGALPPPAKSKAPEASHSGAKVATSSPAFPVGPDYVIGPGDVIDISLWKEESLTKSLVVLPDGRISFPLIGEVQAADRTVGDVKQEIEERLKPYVPEPVLTVEVKQVNSMLIYVIGRVNAPGRFVLNANVNVLQALAAAGGLNPFAKRDKIKIMRQEAGKTKSLPFHYDDVVDGKRLEENVMLKRGDLVVVP